jgi:hypothetical protein
MKAEIKGRRESTRNKEKMVDYQSSTLYCLSASQIIQYLLPQRDSQLAVTSKYSMILKRMSLFVHSTMGFLLGLSRPLHRPTPHHIKEGSLLLSSFTPSSSF